MSNYPYSGYGAPHDEPSAGPNISPAVVRVLCGISAPLGFVCAGLCFYFLVEPFGTNPPPKEVALVAGIVFTCIGLLLAGVAIFYRGTATREAADERRLDTLTNPGQQRDFDAGPDPVQRRPPASAAASFSYTLQDHARASPGRRGGRLGELLGVVALLGILAGPLLGYITFQRQKVLEMGKPDPKVVSVAELGRAGPGDNIHVKITDFQFGNKYAVGKKNGSWTTVCLAAFPGDKSGDPRALKVVVRSNRIHNERELDDFAKRAQVEGVVVNSIYEWENDKEYMKQAYPGVDTSAIWVVQDNYSFPNESEIKTMYAISSGIVGLAVFCGVEAFIRKRS
jgi:hypothetical protein